MGLIQVYRMAVVILVVDILGDYTMWTAVDSSSSGHWKPLETSGDQWIVVSFNTTTHTENSKTQTVRQTAVSAT